MEIELSKLKNLKIVPKNYESGTICEIKDIKNNEVAIKLPFAGEEELKDYVTGEEVELFGLANNGLIYFLSTILNSDKNEFIIKYPENIKEIQRRKYSRVPYDGKLAILDDKNIKTKTDDISAGGLKFFSDTPFMVGQEYNIKVELINNLVVECSMQPIRVEETEEIEGFPYSISAKFKKIRSIDRIALMQYSLRLISELQNKS